MPMDALRWPAVAALIGVAVVHAVRLADAAAHRRRTGVAGEFAHAAMGAVMAAMLIGPLGPRDGRPLAVAFVVLLLWFGWQGLRGFVLDGSGALGAPVSHAVGCAAMVYALLAWSAADGAPGGMAGMTMSGAAPALTRSSALTIALALATAGVAAVTVLRPRAVGLPATPVLLGGCRLTLNASMVYMLLAM